MSLVYEDEERQEEIPIEGAVIDLYKVADLKVSNGTAHYVLTKDFEPSGISFCSASSYYMDDEEESLKKWNTMILKDQPETWAGLFFDFILDNCAVNEISRNVRVERFRELRYNARRIFRRRLN